jgi:hypothetical protein
LGHLLGHFPVICVVSAEEACDFIGAMVR